MVYVKDTDEERICFSNSTFPLQLKMDPKQKGSYEEQEFPENLNIMKYKNVKGKRNLRKLKNGGIIRQEKSLSNRMKVNKFKSYKEREINTNDHKNKQKKQKGSKLFKENNVIIIKTLIIQNEENLK